MRQMPSKFLMLAVALTFSQVAAHASLLTAGYISYDVTSPGSSAQFDIFNGTGPNSSGDPTFPIATSVNFSSLSLTVDFSDGSMVTEPASYFTLALDGLSYNGSPIGIGGTSPQPTEAILTGTFSPTTVTLYDGSMDTIGGTFTATILPSSGSTLADGDLAVIYASTGGVAPVPEPGSWALLATIVGFIVLSRRVNLRAMLRKIPGRMEMPVLGLVLLVACATLVPAAGAAVKQGVATTPSSATAGQNVNVTVTTGWPSGDTTPGNISATWTTTCGGSPITTDSANSLTTIILSSERVNVTVPSSLATGTYYVQLSDSTGGDTDFVATTCSAIQVTASSVGLEACVPASSLGVIAPLTGPAPVKAFVPNGAWCCGSTGLEIVQIENGGGGPVAPVSIPTTDNVNSCAGNPATGEAVCVANTTHVYHISATNTVTTLTSGANTFAGFSGGDCENCGVAVNTLTNQAVITEGYTPSASGSAMQVLNLSNDTFMAPFPVAREVSENIQVDPFDSVILSANEDNFYNLISFNTSGTLTAEYGMAASDPGGELDSSAMDCATRIAIAPGEFTNNIVLSDLTKATYTAGTPGSWTAPTATVSIIGSYSAGLSGSAVAPGTQHLGVVTGEFGGSSFAVLKLPATSGTGAAPALVDYAYVPCVTGMSAGYDPHTLTAYVSPNDGKSYGLFSNWDFSPPNLLKADLAGILALPREGDGHTVIGDTGAGSCLNPTGPLGSTVLTNIASH